MRRCTLIAIGMVLSCLTTMTARAQAPLGTSFTYQGELASEGSPATGACDLRFSLFDAAAGGNQIGGTLCADDLPINSGRFTVSLDFGPVFTGEARFLGIEVRQNSGLGCSDATGYTVLTPRQEMTAAPNAGFALTAATAAMAGNAATLNGQPASFFSNAANLTGTLPGSGLSGTYTGALSLSNPANIFTGNGAAITNLNATNISAGILDAARMPSNWAAGGDLSGFYPSPTIAPGAVTLSTLDPSLQGVLSSLTGVPSQFVPSDAVAWGDNNRGQTDVPALPAGVAYTGVGGGFFHSVALRSDGIIVAWGDNVYGQVGVPALPAGVAYTAVAAGFFHNVALRSDGTVVAWGRGGLGQLNVPVLPAGVTYIGVAAGMDFSVALRSDGTAVAWGLEDFGVLNVPALPAGVTYTAVTCGESHVLAVRSDGTVVGWGNNDFGQLNVPALPSGVTYTAVAGASMHSLALRSDGMVVGCGVNAFGQLDVPALPAGVVYTAVACGERHSMALRSDGTVVAWTDNANGQIDVPVLPEGAAYSGVAAGSRHSLALRSRQQAPYLDTSVGLRIGSSTPPPAAGGISVTGDSSFAGGLAAASFSGNGAGLTNINAANISAGVLDAARMPNDWAAGGDLTGLYPNPTIALGAVTLSKLDAGVQGVLSNLTGVPSTIGPLDAVAWGNNDWGQTNVPALPAGVTYTAVAGGPFHSLALRSDGTVVGWGFHNDGQTNVPALPAGVTYTAIAAGNRHGLAVRSDGTVAAWGRNDIGQTDVPALPTGLTYTTVAAGYFHSLALRSDGTVVAWGSNDFGQTDVPVLPGGVTYTTLACGAYHSLAVRSDGTVVAWGLNNFGQTNVTVLPAGVTYTAVAGGFAHSLAVRSDGTVVGWGRNESGQTSVPALPAGITYTAVAAGNSHSLALRSDGTAVGWGRNERGQADVPMLPDAVTYTAVAAGDSHSLTLRDYQQAAYLDSTAGLRIGSSAAPPAAGGISIAGDSAFAGGLAAGSFTGSGAGLTNLNAANLTGTISDGLLSGNIPRLNTGNTFTGGLAAPSFSGDGAGLTNINAANLTGTISDGVLSGNIPRLDSSNVFAGGLTAPSFSGDGAGLTNLNAANLIGTVSDGRLSGNIPRLNTSNSFAGGVSAASFSGSGAGLTNLNASNINAGTVRQTVLPVFSWSNQLPVNVINPTSYTTVGGTSQVFAMRPGVAVVGWSTSAYTNAGATGFVVRVRAVSGGFVGIGIGTIFYFNQSGVHQTISGNAVVPTTSGNTTFTLEVIRVVGGGNYQTDQYDSLTATIINVGQ